MKNILFSLALLFLSIQISGQIPTASLVAYYPFNNNANDVSGNAQNGTVYGAGLTTDRFGNVNCAYNFNGTTDFISLPPANIAFLNSYSYSLWMKPFSNGTGGMIYCGGDGTTGPCQATGYQANNTLFAGSYNLSGVPLQSYSSSGIIAPGAWTHVVVTRDNSLIQVYVNGVYVAAASTSTINSQNANYGSGNRIYLGARTNQTSYFNGAIDDVRIYSAVLTPVQIGSIYNEPGCYSAVPVATGTTINTCSGNLVTISTPSVGNANINWYGSASATTAVGAGTAFTTPVFSTPGIYTYYVEANTCTVYPRTAVNIIVNSLPSLSINSGAICVGNSFTLSPVGAVTYTYSGGSTIVSPSVTSSFAIIGSNAAGCQSTITSTVTVNQLPTLNISGPSAVCLGNSASLIASGANTFTWNTNQQGAGILVSPITPTTYTVSGTDANGCKNFTQKSLTVLTLPTLTVTGNNTICEGSSTTFFVNGSALTYSWSNGTVGNVATLGPTISTLYTVSCTHANGCVNFTTQIVNVNSSPPVAAIASGTAICEGQSVLLSGSGAASYTWSAGINNAVAFYPTTTSIYAVTGEGSNGCMKTATIQVVVNALPVLTVTSSAQLICSGETVILTVSGANIYTWSSGNITANAVLSPTITATFTVSGTDVNGCMANASIVQKVEECTGLQTVLLTTDASIYPNPASEQVTISLGDFTTDMHFEIINSIGQLMDAFILTDKVSTVALHDYPKGFYLLWIYENQRVITEKKLIVTD